METKPGKYRDIMGAEEFTAVCAVFGLDADALGDADSSAAGSDADDNQPDEQQDDAAASS